MVDVVLKLQFIVPEQAFIPLPGFIQPVKKKLSVSYGK